MSEWTQAFFMAPHTGHGPLTGTDETNETLFTYDCSNSLLLTLLVEYCFVF
jgi:hypothetical protein